MEGRQFDNIARAVANSASRRGFLRGGLGALIAAVTFGFAKDAQAGSTCSGADGSCSGNSKCCNGYTCLNTSCCPSKNVCSGSCCQSPANGSATCTKLTGCVYTCNTGYYLCGNKCIKRVQGSCCSGADCPAKPGAITSCKNFTCTYTCPTGYKDCGDKCVPSTGCCTTAECPSRPNSSVICSSTGTCDYTCNTDYRDCNGSTSDGCESNIKTDTSNCGACGTVCTVAPTNGTPACKSGVCSFTCDTGYKQCGSKCIPNAWCCRDAECSGGKICLDDGSCGCEFVTCNSTCCAAGQVCSGGVCVG